MRGTLSVTMITIALAARPAMAQIKPGGAEKTAANRNTRQGFWIGFGFGEGSETTSCASCGTTRTDGVSGYLKLGGSVSQHILLGGEITGWSHSAAGTDYTLSFGTGTLTWYPSATGAFFLKAGIGVMDYRETDASGNRLEGAAGAGLAGLGYDWRVARNFSITPFLNSLASSSATFTINGAGASTGQRFTFSLVQVGVELTWH